MQTPCRDGANYLSAPVYREPAMAQVIGGQVCIFAN